MSVVIIRHSCGRGLEYMRMEACDRLRIRIYPDRRLRQMLVSGDYGSSDSGLRPFFVFTLSFSIF